MDYNNGYEKAMKSLSKRYIKAIDELQALNREYANWDEWNRTNTIDRALNELKQGLTEQEISDIIENS